MKNNSNNINWFKMDRTPTPTGGPGIFTILQVIFIVLKLTNLIDWSWWLVWTPTFISAGISLTIILIVLIVAGINRLRLRKIIKGK